MKKALVLPLLLTACAHAPSQPEAPLVPYLCEGDPYSITADYYAKNPANTYVILTMNGEKKTLHAVETSTTAGDRYASNASRKVGTLIWWNRHDKAMLYQIAEAANGYTYEKQLAACANNPNPLQAAPLKPMPVTLEGTIPGTAPGFMYKPIPNPGVK